MKYIVLVGDGMADEPIDSIGGKTPIQVAKTPNMDLLAKRGVVGRASFIPEGMYPGSDTGNMSILGFDPKKYNTGRAPLEAANMGLLLKPDEIAFRCNLVTATDSQMVDFSAGHIGSHESSILIKELNEHLATDQIRFHAGVSYRHILIIKNADLIEDLNRISCVPPHDLTGQKYTSSLKNTISIKCVSIYVKTPQR